MSFSRLPCFRLALFIGALAAGTLSQAADQAPYPSVGPLITHAAIQRSQSAAEAVRPAAYGNARKIMLGAPSADQFERLKQLNANDTGVPKPLAVGFPRTPSETVILDNASLNWTYLPDGSQVAQVQINSAGAQAIRLGIRIDRMDAGVEMRFWGSAPSSPVLGPVKTGDIRLQDGIYWAPATFGEDATLEIRLPAGADPNALQGEIVQVSHLAANPIGPRLKSVVAVPGTILPCEVDLACANDPKMTQTANAVAQMLFTKGGSSYVCTGTLMNDTPQNWAPYFYTAAHCISDQSVANTLITWWFYEAASCGGSADLSQEPSLVDGAQLLYTDASTDATLLKLNDTPPGGVIFAGWDATPFAIGDAVVGIHHPAANPAKYSSGSITNTNFAVSLADLNLVVYNFLRIQWNTGLVEPGSSGSGLFTAGTYIFKGSLTATPAGGQTCGGNSAYYSPFASVYPNVSQFLNPTPTQQRVVITGSASGPATSTSVSFQMTPLPADVGKVVNLYVGLLYTNGTLLLYDGSRSAWLAPGAGPLPVFERITLGSTVGWALFSNVDMTKQPHGLTAYIGYGASDADLLSGKYGPIYTVP